MPNGNTLIADSRNFRVLEVGPDGEVVWAHELTGERGIVYDADRFGVGSEEPGEVPAGRELDGTAHGGTVGETLAVADSWVSFVLPPWVGVVGLLALLTGGGALAGLAREGYRARAG